jgi:hypothetical protein
MPALGWMNQNRAAARAHRRRVRAAARAARVPARVRARAVRAPALALLHCSKIRNIGSSPFRVPPENSRFSLPCSNDRTSPVSQPWLEFL